MGCVTGSTLEMIFVFFVPGRLFFLFQNLFFTFFKEEILFYEPFSSSQPHLNRAPCAFQLMDEERQTQHKGKREKERARLFPRKRERERKRKKGGDRQRENEAKQQANTALRKRQVVRA